MKHLYVKTTFAVPGAGNAVHIAELRPIEGTNMCSMSRLIEMMDGHNISGVWSSNGTNSGMVNQPIKHVPHPDSFHNFPDIEVSMLTALQFEGLWLQGINQL